MTEEEKLASSLGTKVAIHTDLIKGRHINYAVAGTGKPIILIHGGTFGWGWWYKNIAELANQFQVYAIDVPGSGRSSRVDLPEHDFMGQYVNPVADFIDAHNLSEASIVGHSFGGWIALKLVQMQGVKSEKLLLVGPTGLAEYASMSDRLVSFRPFANFLAKTSLNPKKGNHVIVKFLHTAFAKKDVQLLLEFLDYERYSMQRSHAMIFISKLIANRKLLHIHERELSGIRQKTLLLWGEKDRIMPLAFSQPSIRFMPNATLRVMRNVGHVPFLEEPEQFIAIARDFLI